MGSGEEVVLGAAQLLLEAEHAKLKEDIDKVKATLQSGEKSFEELTETASSQGRKLLRDRQRVDAALLQLTATTAQKEMAAIDKKYATALAASKRTGDRTLELERAIAAEKRKIRMKDEADELRGSNVIAGARRKVAAESKALGQATDSAKQQAQEFRHGLHLAGAEIGRLSSGISLLAAGLNPVAVGLGAAAAALVAYTERLKETRRANEEFLRSTADSRARIRGLELEHAEKMGLIQDAEVEKLKDAIIRQETLVDEAQRERAEYEAKGYVKAGRYLAKPAEDRGDTRIPIISDLGEVSGTWMQNWTKDTEELEGKVRKEMAALDELRARLRSAEDERKRADQVKLAEQSLDLQTRKNQETAKGLALSAEEERNHAAALEAESKQARQREKEVATLRKQAMEEWKRELAEFNRAAEERVKIERAVASTILELRGRAAERSLELDQTNERARRDLIQVNKERELDAFANKAVDLETAARDMGLDVTELERRLWEERTAIVKKYEAEIVGSVTKEAEAYGLIKDSARSAADAVASLQDVQREATKHPFFQSHVTSPFTGFGPDPFAKQRVTPGELEAMRLDAMQKFPELFGGAAAAAKSAATSVAGAAAVKVNVFNKFGDLIGVQASQRTGPDGTSIDIILADSIPKGGAASRALEERYGLQAGSA